MASTAGGIQFSLLIPAFEVPTDLVLAHLHDLSVQKVTLLI